MSKKLTHLFIFSVFLMLYLPIVILMIYSFNDARFSMKISTVSLKWYFAILENKTLIQSAKNSLALAIMSSSITSLFAALTSAIFYFYSFKSKKSLHKLILMMIMLPDIIFAIGLLLLFNFLKLTLGFYSLLVAHVCFSLPFAVMLINNRITALDKNLLTVCQDLGAYDFYAFRKIIFPLLSTAIISAWLLAFTLSFDDVLISYFTSGPKFQILPLYIYSLIRTGITPEINALCSIMFLISALMISLSYKFMKKKS